MRTVHKFLVPFAGPGQLPRVRAHPASPVRHCGIDPRTGDPAVWIERHTEDEVPKPGRLMAAFGTGHEIPGGWSHVGSLIDGKLVWHIYEGPGA